MDTYQNLNLVSEKVFNFMKSQALANALKSSNQVSIKSLLLSPMQIEGSSSMTIEQLSFMICCGGFSQALNADKTNALETVKDYVDTLIYGRVLKADELKRDPVKVFQLLKALAKAIAKDAKIPTLQACIKSNDHSSISKPTIINYLKLFKLHGLIDELDAWQPHLSTKAIVRKSAIKYFCDPAIAVAILKLSEEKLIYDIPTMEKLFKNLCISQLRSYTALLSGKIFHYKDSDNLTCDAVLNLNNGQYGLIEIKLGGDKSIEEGANTLNKLEQKLDLTKMKKPAFKMVLAGITPYAYRRLDGVYVVPISTLCP